MDISLALVFHSKRARPANAGSTQTKITEKKMAAHDSEFEYWSSKVTHENREEVAQRLQDFLSKGPYLLAVKDERQPRIMVAPWLTLTGHVQWTDKEIIFIDWLGVHTIQISKPGSEIFKTHMICFHDPVKGDHITIVCYKPEQKEVLWTLQRIPPQPES